MIQFGINFARACLQVATTIASGGGLWENSGTNWEAETDKWEEIE